MHIILQTAFVAVLSVLFRFCGWLGRRGDPSASLSVFRGLDRINDRECGFGTRDPALGLALFVISWAPAELPEGVFFSTGMQSKHRGVQSSALSSARHGLNQCWPLIPHVAHGLIDFEPFEGL